MYTKGSINADQRIVAKGDIHSENMITAKKAFVTPGNVFAEGVVKASKDVRAGNFVYGLGMSADTKGMQGQRKGSASGAAAPWRCAKLHSAIGSRAGLALRVGAAVYRASALAPAARLPAWLPY